MERRDPAPQTIVFGPFSFDISSLELWRCGVKVRLEDKPARILAILLQHAGTLISREDLRKTLWPEGVHIDFDHGLNKSVNKLRFALGDTASEPRFIETLSRRGYRFIGVAELFQNGTEKGAALSQGKSIAGDISTTNDTPQRVSSPRASWKAPTATLLAVTIIAISGYFVRARIAHSSSSPPDHARIVVLPFVNLTGNIDEEYLCDGLTEELVSQLSTVGSPHLAVIARTSAMKYKGSNNSAKQIAQELGVDYVLESSVRNSGGHLRITAQLIEAHSDSHIWADSYDRDLSDVLDMQRAIALNIVHQIKLQISPGVFTPRASQRISPQAHEAYLRGRYAWNQRTIPSLHSAVDYFDRAIALEPSYAEAYSGLADAESLLASSGGAPYREAYPVAKDMARKALSLNSSLPDAHTSLAFIEAFYDWKFEEAEAEFRRAMTLDESYVTAHHWFGMYLSETGRFAEGVAELQLAHQLDPLSLAVWLDLADAYFRAGDDSNAYATYLKVREIDGENLHAYKGIASVHALEHKFNEAEAENKLNKDRFGQAAGIDLYLLVQYVSVGDRDHAKALFSSIEQEAKRHYFRPNVEYASLAIFGDKRGAMKFLEDGFRARADWMVGIKSDPLLMSLHSDPQFQDLLHRVGFTE